MRAPRLAPPLAALLLGSVHAGAQEADVPAEPSVPTEAALEPPPPGATPDITFQYTPPATPTGTVTAPDVNTGLNQSNQPLTNINTQRDGFDFRPGGAQGTTVRGSATGAYVVSGAFVPEMHAAQRGDTLWSISGRYFGNPYNWPRVWSYNRQLQNPHWIYPGDQIRLREPHVKSQGLAFSSFQGVGATVPPSAKFVPHVGFVLDGKYPAWGEIVGSPEDQMILSEEDEVYIKLEGDREYRLGQKLVVFEPRDVKDLSDDPLVWIRGVVQINRYNPKTRMARARVIESMLEIERGAKVGPFEQLHDTITPVRNKKTVVARIIGALYPHEFYGQNQFVFIDKGSEDGLEVGNRLFAVTRSDQWRATLETGGNLADIRAITEDDRMGRTERTPDEEHEDLYPPETYAELLVVRVREHTATVLVTASTREIPRGAPVVAREGY